MTVESLKKEARRHEQREEWVKALDLYLQAIERQAEEHEPDVALHNRVGDLQVRLGDLEGAIENYEQAIQLYVDAELPNNAIAICRKISRHDPERPIPFLRMGQIRAKQGFTVDARQNFVTYAEMMQARGETEEALRALEEYVGLAADDIDTRVFLAEQLVARDRSSEAVGYLAEAHRIAMSEGGVDRAGSLLERIHAIEPDYQPDDRGSTSVPDAGPEPFASRADEMEDEVWPSYDAPATGVELDLSSDAAGEVPVESSESMGEDVVIEDEGAAEEAGATGWDVEDLEITGFGSGELESTSAGPTDEGETIEHGLLEDDLVQESLSETGTADDLELAAEVSGPETFAEEYQAAGEGEAAIAEGEAVTAEDESLLTGEFSLADLDDETGEGEVPDLLESGAEDLDINLEDLEDLAIERVDLDLDVGTTGESRFESAGPKTREPAPDVVAALRARVDREPGDANAWEGLGEALLALGWSREGRDALEKAHGLFHERGEPAEAMRVVRELLAREPNRIELRQRMVEYAHETDDRNLMVEAFLELAEGLRSEGEPLKAAAVFEQVLALDPENADALAALGGAPAAPGAMEEAAAAHDDARVSPAEKTETEAVPAGSEGDYVDLGAMVLEAETEANTRFVVPTEEPSGDEEADFARMLSQFKEKVAQNISRHDARSHYDLGTAYKEMGLLREAIGEFQQALRAQPDNLATFEMLGQCFLEMGDAEVAIRTLERGLKLPIDVEDELLGVYYGLAQAHEEVGDADAAREFYERIFSLDINFKDVVERLNALR